MKVLNKILYILMFVLSFILIGVTSLFEIGLGKGTLQDPVFYTTQIICYVAILLTTLGTVYTVIDKFKEKNEEYIATDKFISDFAQDKRYIPSFISKFLEWINRKRKIAQYKHNIKKRLYKLTNYKPWYWYLLPWRWGIKKYTDSDLHVWNYGTAEEKAANEYCKQRALIEEQLLDEYIEKNIDNDFVKYDKITEAVIIGGYYDKGEGKGPNEYIEKNLSGKIVAHKIPTLCISFGLTFFLSLIVVESLMFKTDAIVSVCVKFASLIWTAFSSLRYGKELCDTVILRDIRFRKGLITEYDKWVLQQVQEQEEKENARKHGPNVHDKTTGTTRKESEVHTDSIQPEQ